MIGGAMEAGTAGLFGFGQQHMAYNQQKRMQSRQYGFDRSMAEYAYSKELEQWHRANEWNLMVSDPKFQMDRLKGAGLNPNLIYGQGAAGSGQTAAQLPKYQAPRYPDAAGLNPAGFGVSGAMDGIARMVGLTMQGRQMDKMQAEKELLENKAINELARTPGLKGDSQLKSELARYASDFAFAKRRQVESDASTAHSRAYVAGSTKDSLIQRIRADASTATTRASRESEEFRRYRSIGMTSQDSIQWRIAVNMLRALGVNLMDPSSIFGETKKPDVFNMPRYTPIQERYKGGGGW